MDEVEKFRKGGRDSAREAQEKLGEEIEERERKFLGEIERVILRRRVRGKFRERKDDWKKEI